MSSATVSSLTAPALATTYGKGPVQSPSRLRCDSPLLNKETLQQARFLQSPVRATLPAGISTQPSLLAYPPVQQRQTLHPAHTIRSPQRSPQLARPLYPFEVNHQPTSPHMYTHAQTNQVQYRSQMSKQMCPMNSTAVIRSPRENVGEDNAIDFVVHSAKV